MLFLGSSVFTGYNGGLKLPKASFTIAACPVIYCVIQKKCTILHISLNIKKKYTIDTGGGLLKTYI